MQTSLIVFGQELMCMIFGPRSGIAIIIYYYNTIQLLYIIIIILLLQLFIPCSPFHEQKTYVNALNAHF